MRVYLNPVGGAMHEVVVASCLRVVRKLAACLSMHPQGSLAMSHQRRKKGSIKRPST